MRTLLSVACLLLALLALACWAVPVRAQHIHEGDLGLVWVITVMCISLTCEPLPKMAGWFYSEEDCIRSIGTIQASWKPEAGKYRYRCDVRSVI